MLLFVLKFSLLFIGLLLVWLSELRMEDKRIHVKINLGQLRDTCSVPCELFGDYFSKIFTESEDSDSQEKFQELTCEQMGLGASDINCFLSKTVPNEPLESSGTQEKQQEVSNLSKVTELLEETKELGPSNKPQQGYHSCRRPNMKKELIKFVEEYAKKRGKALSHPTREKISTPQPSTHEMSLIVVPSRNRTELIDFLPVLIQLKAFTNTDNPPSHKRITKIMYNSYFRHLKKISWLTSELD